MSETAAKHPRKYPAPQPKLIIKGLWVPGRWREFSPLPVAGTAGRRYHAAGWITIRPFQPGVA